MRSYLIVQFLFGCLFASSSYGQDVEVEWQREFTKARSVHFSKSGNRIVRILSDTTFEQIDGRTGDVVDTILLPIKVKDAGFAGESLIVQSPDRFTFIDSLWIVDLSGPAANTPRRLASPYLGSIQLFQNSVHLFVRSATTQMGQGGQTSYVYWYYTVDSVGEFRSPEYLKSRHPGDLTPPSVNTIDYGVSTTSEGPPRIYLSVVNPRTGFIESGRVYSSYNYAFLTRSRFHAVVDNRLHNIRNQQSIPLQLGGKKPIAYLGGSKCLVSSSKNTKLDIELYDIFNGFIGVIDTGFHYQIRSFVRDSGRAVFLCTESGTRISRLVNRVTDQSFSRLVHSEIGLTPQHKIVDVFAALISDVEVSRYELRINGSVYSSANGDFRFRHSDLGEHPVRLLAFDVDNRVALDTIVFTINCVRRGNPTDELVPALHRADQDLPTNLEVAPSAGHICISTFDSTTFWQVSRSPLGLQRLYTPNAEGVLSQKRPAGWFHSDQELYDSRGRPSYGLWGTTYYRWNHESNTQLHPGYHGCPLTLVTYPHPRSGPSYECVSQMQACVRTTRNRSSTIVWYRHSPRITSSKGSYVAIIPDTSSSRRELRALQLESETVVDIDYVNDTLFLLVKDSTIEFVTPTSADFVRSIQRGFESQTCAFYIDSSTLLTSSGLYQRGLDAWSLMQRFPFRDAVRFVQATPKHILVLRRNSDTIGCVFDIVSQKITSWLGSSHGTPHIAAYARNPKELFVLDSFGVLGVYDMPEEITSYASPDPIEITTRLAPTFLGGALRLRAPNGATAIELYDIHGLLFKRIPLIGVVSDSIEVPVGSMPERSVIAVVVRSPTGVTRHLIMTP